MNLQKIGHTKRRFSREPKKSVVATTQEQYANSAALETKPGRQTKIGKVTALLQRAEGATVEKLVHLTGWQKHTARAALTGLKKKGHQVTSVKADGEELVYRVAAG